MRNTNVSTYILLMLGWCSKYSYKVGSSKLSIFLNSEGRDVTPDMTKKKIKNFPFPSKIKIPNFPFLSKFP